MKYIFGTFLAILILIFVGWAIDWMGQPAQIAGVDNVRTQFADGYRNYNSLQAMARNICTAKKAITGAADQDERIQRVTQELALEQNYNRISANYDAAMQNAFAAKYVKPGDLPREAPTLDQSLQAAGCS